MATVSYASTLLPNRSKMSFEGEMRQNIETVTISKVEHEYLVTINCISVWYIDLTPTDRETGRLLTAVAKLKGSLLNGGLSQETLDVLIYGVQAPPKSSTQENHENAVPQPAGSSVKDEYVSPSETLIAQKYLVDTDREDRTGGESEDYADGDDEGGEEDALMTPAEEKCDNETFSKGRQGSVAPSVQRTVLIRNIPERTTNEDVIAAVRGGALLHLYLRPRERVANVSFVDESAARAFLQHTKAYGLHVAGKPVSTSWCDRQFYLPPYVGAKVKGGATRILVVHNVHPSITEDLIRKDLDHIHNLIVISVTFKNGRAYIATNSIHNALFARSCMMSRRTYKGLHIGFDADECAGPLATTTTTMSKTMPKKLSLPSPNKPSSRPNRFQVLSFGGSEGEAEDEAEDDTEDEDETDDYESISNELNSHSSRNGGVEADDSYWALSS